ncbi:MAG: CHASE3 domain-containing protein, partial [Hyphomicrobiales bacterium]|nr:CHASE3 domain-containing protein [Hyphomicrobiales bacterium]
MMFRKSRRFVGYNLVFLAFGVIALLIMVITSVLYSNRTQTHAADALTAARLDALLLKYQSDLVDAETSLRGYQLVRREDYLAPYRDALAEIPGDAKAIRDNAAAFSRPEIDPALIDELFRLGEAKLALVRGNLETLRAGDTDAAAMMAASDRGKVA